MRISTSIQFPSLNVRQQQPSNAGNNDNDKNFSSMMRDTMSFSQKYTAHRESAQRAKPNNLSVPKYIVPTMVMRPEWMNQVRLDESVEVCPDSFAAEQEELLIYTGPLEWVSLEDQPELIVGGARAVKGVKSVYDLVPDRLQEHLWQANMDAIRADTTGMSKADIYNHIEQIFTEYLGEDFYEPMVTGRIRGLAGNFPMSEYFDSALRSHGIKLGEDPSILIEARGYTGMSDSEIRAAVRAGYPKDMTVGDCMMMERELWGLGVEEGVITRDTASFMVTIIMGTGVHTLGISDEQANQAYERVYDMLLGMPANYDTLRAAPDAHRRMPGMPVETGNAKSMGDLTNILAEWTGVRSSQTAKSIWYALMS